MNRLKLLVRRLALVELTKATPPQTYDVRPKNRQMRRAMAREMRRKAKPEGGAGK